MLARLREDNDSLVMPGVPLDEREMLIESQPKVFYFTDHYRDYPMVLIRLSKAKRAIVEPLLRRHWRTLASKKAVKDTTNRSIVIASEACNPSQAYGLLRFAPALRNDSHDPTNSSPPRCAIPPTRSSPINCSTSRCRMPGSSRDAWCRRCGTC